MHTTTQIRPFTFVKNGGNEETITKFAEHCAFATEESLAECPQIVTHPALAIPPICLTDFIELLLRSCNISLSVALTTLAVINWMTEDGLECPFISSTPHHLFMATYQAILRPALKTPNIDFNPPQDTGYYMHVDDRRSMVLEVEEFLSTLHEGHWAFLRSLASQNVASTMEQLDELEALEAEDRWDSAEEPDYVEEEFQEDRVTIPGNIYDQESGSESTLPTPPLVAVHEPWPAKKVPISRRVWTRVQRVTPRFARAFGFSSKS